MAGKRSRATYEADLQSIQSPYVFYGTPLPPLDSNVRDDGSFVPIWKQEVTDERGRKRLHGAFTGGFSAGYFNTVGSKEGWTPATFVSSKSNRWKDNGKKPQNVDDIMDEEDKADAEESRQISTQSGYNSLGSTEAEVKRRVPLMDLFRSSNDTMGFNLLRKMGWKDGQGIGSRVLRQAVLHDGVTSGKKATGKHLFAPANTKLILITRKTDRKGLGYRGEGSLDQSSRHSPDRSDNDEARDTKTRKQGPTKSAMGVGILNDTGSDDEDPFSLGPRISYSKVIGGDKKRKKKTSLQSGGNSNPLLSKRPVFVSVKANKTLTGFRKCHDGRLPLEGFILSISKPVTETIKHSPPKVPEHWKSAKSAPSSDPSNAEWQSSADLAKSSTLQPSSRGEMLGEAPLPGKSVFDFIKPEGRARLVTLTQNENLPPARSESSTKDLPLNEPGPQIPSLDASIASSALGRGVAGFIPYTDNPAKLSRYRAYLSYNAGITTEIPIKPPDLTKDEWFREMQEFAHAATIFKPMTGSIATRFTTASAASLQPRDSASSETSEMTNQQKQSKDPAEEAAAMSMFGPLTRSSTFFYPSRLLCKRFNVPIPAHVNSGNEGTTSINNNNPTKSLQWSTPQSHNSKPTTSTSTSTPNTSSHQSTFNSRFQSSGYQMASNQEPIPVNDSVSLTTDVHNKITSQAPEQSQNTDSEDTNGHASAMSNTISGVDPDRNEALEKDRPGDDVFRAVFGSDSDSD